jgi:hypothetical protein
MRGLKLPLSAKPLWLVGPRSPSTAAMPRLDRFTGRQTSQVGHLRIRVSIRNVQHRLAIRRFILRSYGRAGLPEPVGAANGVIRPSHHTALGCQDPLR